MSLDFNIRNVLLACLFVYAGFSSVAQVSDFSFRQITLEDGLSQTSVYSIYQDYRGFMWFGTFDGLNRYDGRSVYQYMTYGVEGNHTLSNGNIWGLDGDRKSRLFIATLGGGLNVLTYGDGKIKHYKKTKDPNSINDNNVLDVAYVNDSTVWVICESGASRFNPRKETFINYPFITDKFKFLSNVRGHTVFISENKDVWVGTYGAGLLKLNVKNGSYAAYRNNLSSKIEGDYIRDIDQYKDSLMLLATLDGLYIFNPRTGVYTDTLLKGENLFGLIPDKKGNFWITSIYNGVYCLTKDGIIKQYSHYYYDPYSFPDNMTVNGYCDDLGNVWIGTYNEGAVFINENRKPFLHIYWVPEKPSITTNSVFSLAEVDDNKVWIGTENGLSVWDRRNDTFKEIKLLGQTNGNVNIWNIFHDKNDDLWLATSTGVVKYNLKTRKQTRYFKKNDDPHSLINNHVNCILRKGSYIWIATRYGLSRFDERTNSFHNYIDDKSPNSISNSLVWRIYLDSSNRLWFCTVDGLNLYNDIEDNFKVFRFDEGENGLFSNDISEMLEVKKDIFWLATSKGIRIFDFNKGKIIRNIGVNDGLESGYTYRMLRAGNEMWVSTNKGLVVIDINTYEVKATYHEHDGLQSNEFNTAATKLSDGYFLFGGVKGVTGFYPDQIKTSDYSPPLYFTGLSLHGRESYINDTVKSGEIVYIKDIIEASQVTFTPDEKMFSFRFAALDYNNPEEVNYFYRLLPESREWISLRKRNFVTFVNLNPGEYTLQIRSTNSDDILCDNQRSIKIVMLPPFWKQKWVIGFEVLLALLAVYLLFKYRTYKLNRDKRKLEQIVNERTQEIEVQKDRLEKLAATLEQKVKERTSELEAAKQKAEESDMLKSAFLSNMSHEIRTPMNAIMGFSELLVTQGFSEEERKSFANMVKSNGEALLTLLNDIIDISMIESGQLKLNFMDVKLYNLVSTVYNTFGTSLLLAEKKGAVELKFRIDDADKKVVVNTDYHRLLQIMNNLVGNAIKFTNNGSVEFGYALKEKEVEFFIKDTGIGIDEQGLKNIFKRFYKMQNGQANFYPGNGLGLTITKNLVEALNGKIRVESKVGKGTTFWFTIPA